MNSYCKAALPSVV